MTSKAWGRKLCQKTSDEELLVWPRLVVWRFSDEHCVTKQGNKRRSCFDSQNSGQNKALVLTSIRKRKNKTNWVPPPTHEKVNFFQFFFEAPVKEKLKKLTFWGVGGGETQFFAQFWVFRLMNARGQNLGLEQTLVVFLVASFSTQFPA